MAASTFLAIGLVGLVLLAVSAFLGGDEADFDAETDIGFDVDADVDVDVDVDGDFDTDTSHGGGGGGAILQWFSIKAMSVAAVGFGFMGWALKANDSAAALVWIVSTLVGVLLWVLAVRILFPWLRKQQGDDLQSVEAYQGLTAQVVVRVPPGSIGTVQFTDPNGAVIRSDARAVHRDQEMAVGKQVLIILATAEHVVVDEFTDIESS